VPTPDPYAVLGIGQDADAREAAAARRRLARQHHPDHGGDESRMREVNEAYRLVLDRLRDPPAPPRPQPSRAPAASDRAERRRRPRVEHDWPSFTIDVLPAEAFEALLVVATWIGEVLADEPPYVLDVVLAEPEPCWCRLELLPEAGGSIVNLTVAGIDDAPAPDAETVRDVWLAALNDLHRAES
jgi:hypothetical protein